MLFTLATDVQTRIRSFRSDRLAMISAGRGPVVLSPRGRLFVHLISLSAFGQSAQIDLDMAHQIRPRFGPMDAKGTRSRFNLDGLINVSSDDERPGYTQVFRSGIVEATTSNILHEWRPNTVWPRELPSYTVCHAGAITSYITEVLPGYFEGLQALDVPPPIVVSVSFQGVMGAKLGVWGYDNRLDQIEPLPHVDPLLLPDVIVDDYGPPQDYDRMMRPIFDALWNAAGFSRCTYYNAEGNWQPPH